MARGRDSKGRFLKRGSAAMVRSGGGGGMARRGSASVTRRAPRGGIITVRESIVVKEPKRKGRLRSIARGVVTNHMAIGVTVGSAAYGYLCNSPNTMDLMARIPTVAAVGPHLSRGLVLWFLNKHTIRNKYVDQVALGALAIGGFALGKGAASSAVTPAVIGGSIGDGDDLGDYDDDDGE